MDVGTIFSHHRRNDDDDDGNHESGPRKRLRRDDDHEQRANGHLAGVDQRVSELEADNEESTVTGAFDVPSLKRLVAGFERKILKNQEQRIKFSQEPTKFLDSELELFDSIQELSTLSTQPELYESMVALNFHSALIGLLCHENSDIACGVVSVLQELTDIDESADVDDVKSFLDALIESQLIAQLVENMKRMDESVKEESQCVYNSLSIVENLTDYDPTLSQDVKPLMEWILKRLRLKIPFDANKLYASEILSILLQNGERNRVLIAELNGMDVLLHQVAVSNLTPLQFCLTTNQFWPFVGVQEARPVDGRRAGVCGKHLRLHLFFHSRLSAQSKNIFHQRRPRTHEPGLARKKEAKLGVDSQSRGAQDHQLRSRARGFRQTFRRR